MPPNEPSPISGPERRTVEINNVIPLPGVALPAGDFRDRILYKTTKTGRKIEDCTANAITILRCDPAWAGLLAWNSLAQGIVVRGELPWDVDDVPIQDPANTSGAWQESDAIRVQAWLKRHYSLSVTPREAYSAALIVAEGARFDPLQDWIENLAWDGTPRVETWLHQYLGADDSPYTRFVGRAFLVSAVARGLRPGCKVDTMIVLEGDQGARKSSALRALFGEEWFSDTPLELTDKDRFMGLRGIWCHEMAELDSFGRADVARIKNFLSSPTDNFRPPYAQTAIRVLRRCVFAGTVNPSALGYLRDETGNRRIWPVRCGAWIDLESIERDRAQIWAEAKEMYGQGPAAGGLRWWPETKEERAICNEEQEERLVGDVWMGKIHVWLSTNRPSPETRITIREVLTDCIGIETAKQDRGCASRVGSCLQQLGWEVVARAKGDSGARERFYARRQVPAAETTR